MELDNFLHQAVVVLGAAVAVLLLSYRLKVPPIAGLLLTGLAIGPSATGLVSDLKTIHVLAEIGVMLLLFVIGLELSFSKLKEVRRTFLIGGSVQALVTTLIGAAAATAWWGLGPGSALFYGFVLTLSSTAIVLKLLDDRRETSAPHGKVSLAILIFQDFLIVPMIVLTPMLGGAVAASAAGLASRFGGSFIAIALVFVAARYLMPQLFYQFARTRVREVFVLGALGTCLGMAWMTHSLGFSLALGAFLAGILVSETEYSHQVVAEILPFRDVFASVFFVSIGMLVDLGYVAQHAGVVFGLALAVVVVKALAIALAVMVLRFPLRTILSVALGLAQIGEFSFVLMEVGRTHGLLQGDRYQLVLSAAVLTMLATPALSQFGPAALLKLYARSGRKLADAEPAAAAERSGHVIVVGYGLGGSLLVRVLRETAIPYVVIELNGEIVRQALKAGEPMIYGDATREAILRHAGIETATVVVFAVSDPTGLR
ncbi:MAG: cation:proton antiporter, partial [Acidobacteriota bacterium]